MKNKKNLFIVIGIIIALTILLIVVLTTYKDKKETNNNMSIIKKNYDMLTENVSEYNDIRSKYSEMSAVLIMDSYAKKDEEFRALLTEYNETIEKIDGNITSIGIRCNRLYNDKEINNICNGYKDLYEKLVNYYVNDLAVYNKFITEYNEYKMQELTVFDMIHDDYIDYNKDGVYEGSNNNGEN